MLQQVEPEHHDCVTIFFSDIVGFTDISTGLSPVDVMNMLDRLYRKFDALASKHDIFKVCCHRPLTSTEGIEQRVISRVCRLGLEDPYR